MGKYDKIIIGGGLYGLYSALYCCRKGQKILVLECDEKPFSRATFINQARVHQGYHYPRSLSTALKTAEYYERFIKDFGFCINSEFDQIYATSVNYSWSDRKQFLEFCKAAGIPCEELCAGNYFKSGMCDGVFRTRECTYDAMILKDYFLAELEKFGSAFEIRYGAKIKTIEKDGKSFVIGLESGDSFESGFVLNAAYAGANQILDIAGFERFKIKYELCEIILCEVNDDLKDIGFTVMDGPFFSIMPFGKTGLHSLTSVTFTPHNTSFGDISGFACVEKSQGHCTLERLGNCNSCPARPESAWPYMAGLARKYMLDNYEFKYKQSLFSMKPILMSSEITDSRPTVIRTYSKEPSFVGVLSGKINTIYDLNEVLDDE
ncbi:MAG: FAD-binding oxidoreductase [Ruminococcaceae bacterium]|nr:FAD-binding oxidoreductase [Oscillospiraceae bacterium]